MDFKINIKDIKIASGEGEKSISKTIEELLELNKKIPARWGEETIDITEKQLEKGDKYKGKLTPGKAYERGEVEEVTERQFDKRNEPDFEVVEVRFDQVKPKDEAVGHRPEAYEDNKEKIRGHKFVPKIWIEVYDKEDKRKDNGNLKKKLK